MPGLPEVRIQNTHAADENRHLGRRQTQELGPVDQKLFRRSGVSTVEVVAEPVCDRFEHGERLDVGLFLGGIRAAGSERNLHDMSGILRGLLDGCASAQHDDIGQRHTLPLACAPLNSRWMPSRASSTVANRAGWLTSHSLCGARRMRAPFAPPRRSEPRKVEAEAQAVETRSEMESPDARILALRSATSLSSIG